MAWSTPRTFRLRHFKTNKFTLSQLNRDQLGLCRTSLRRCESNAPHVAPDRPVAGQVAVDRLLAARTTPRPLPVRGVPPRRILSGYLPPPTSPLSYSDPRLPLPPTPNGIAPNATLPRPFEALPYYYQAPAYNSGPDVRYLQSYDAYGPYIPPPLDIPSNPLPTY